MTGLVTALCSQSCELDGLGAHFIHRVTVPGCDLQALGVRTVAIPRQAKISPARKATEHSRSFRRLIKWRTGSEGRISYLKHTYGWDRTRPDGRQGAAIWCGHGVFTHNLVKIGALAS